MSSGKTLNAKYWDYDTDVTVGVVKINDGFGKSSWFVFTNEDDKGYGDWQTAIKVAYGERTP